MKLLWILALILSVNGYGEVEQESMEITVTEAEEDIYTGDMRMNVEGDLLCSTPLTVTITRSAAGLTDEFCCADQCQTGNEQTSETKNYTPNGMTNWYAHYTPVAGSKQTITYRFDDGTEAKTVTVHYDYSGQGIDAVSTKVKSSKVLREGNVVILRNEKTYSIQGTKID